MNVFSITTVRGDQSSARCVGVFTTLEKATLAITDNWGDIYEEGEYPFVVIESIVSDCMYGDNFGKSNQWFEWKDEGYQAIATPEWAVGISGWGVG